MKKDKPHYISELEQEISTLTQKEAELVLAFVRELKFQRGDKHGA